MMVRNFFRIVAAQAILLASPLAIALSNDELRHAIDQYMANYSKKLTTQYGPQTRIEYSIPALDTRQNPADCAAPLTLQSKEQGQIAARMSLQISCNRGANWSIYVPIDVAVYRQIVTASKPLTHGSTLTTNDVQLSEIDVTRVIGQYQTNLDDVVGMEVKRSVANGLPVLAEQLTPPLLIRRGDTVMISAESEIIAVKTQGVALTDGRRGEQIRIKNQTSSRIVDARVVGPGQAVVSM